jgi:hypothetical protein
MHNKDYKYRTLAELKAAYDTAVLTDRDCIILDNDSTPVYLWEEDEDDHAEKVFDGGCPEQLLEEALTLLGIPWRGA